MALSVARSSGLMGPSVSVSGYSHVTAMEVSE